MARILICDDDEIICMQLAEVLKDEHQVSLASDGLQGLELIKSSEFDLVISDISMPNLDGLELLDEVNKLRPDLCFILITAQPSVETVQRALRDGAFDYVTKDRLLADTIAAVNRAVDRLELRRENRFLHEVIHEKYSFDKIIGKSPQMQKVFETIRKVLYNDTTVLILGETGSGKEMVAKAIHFNGKRRRKPYVAVNCAAISPHLLESELFGHERGAFTGAVASKKGLFEEADGGTIFLDEVSEMARDLQSKLLRVLQEREVQRVGATKPRKIDVRVIAASNRDLAVEVEEDRFRADLFYRLNVVPIPLPPLRERTGDVAFLARHFLKVHCRRHGVELKQLDKSAVEFLDNYAWPGNVRELENEIERAISLHEDLVLKSDAFAHLTGSGRPRLTSFSRSVNNFGEVAGMTGAKSGEMRSLSDIERDHILGVLESCGGNKSKAAKILDIDYSTLLRKLRKLKKDADS